MSSIWKLNGADIYVSSRAGQDTPKVAELNPINASSSIFHLISHPSHSHKIDGVVIGSGYMDTIIDTPGSEVTLISDLIPAGETIFVEDVSYQRNYVFKQYVDTAQDVTAPVYNVSVTFRI